MTEDKRRIVILVLALVVGAALIAVTLRVPRGGVAFFATGFANAAVWIVAAALCRPISFVGGRSTLAPSVAIGVATAGAAFAVFVLGAEIGREFAVLAGPIDSILRKADAGPVWLIVVVAVANGVAEELFFRGAVIDVLQDHHPLPWSVVIYVGVTAMAGNTALIVAAIVMGTVFAIERVTTRGLVAPITTHVVWSALVILALPR